jgi:UDP-N-acetylmuramoyl-tripeptide--D-alanyl-D-alanine ligase
VSALWTFGELRGATGGWLSGEGIATGVSIDTRSLVPGDLFVALRAGRDGHEFVSDAFARGAVAALVDHVVEANGPQLRVQDTLEGLTALGAAGRARFRGRCIAVTGSVGKTTVKEMLRRACAGLGPTHASAASHNNHWGVPLTLARLPGEARWAVVEIGMNNRGEIAPLSRLARPQAAIITTIGTAHIGHLGSQEAIALEKADICAGLVPGGTAVLPEETPFLPLLREVASRQGARIVTFGAAQLLECAADAEGSRLTLDILGTRVEVSLAQPGRHMAMNALAALNAIAALGGDPQRAAAALSGFGAGAGRGERRRIATADGGQALLLDESYNASDVALRAALAVLASQPARRRIAVLGDMLELGEFGAGLHEALAPDVAAAADLVYACGPLMAGLFVRLPPDRRGAHAADAASLAPLLRAALRDGDAILVKGSLGMKMAGIVQALLYVAETS